MAALHYFYKKTLDPDKPLKQGSLMEWDKKYQHGIIWQDFQHKQLADKMAELMQSLLVGNDKETFFETIKFLRDYSASHFRIEELYMKQYEFPDSKNHALEHRKFVRDLNEFVSNCIYKEAESSSELINSLTEWFFNHTQTTDKVFAEFLLDKSAST